MLDKLKRTFSKVQILNKIGTAFGKSNSNIAIEGN